jgi:glycosyltransferase involved in cell wall biosynthesis
VKRRISIGLPVYNGENYVGLAIESILSQSFADFELIISDNASQDKTESICRSFAEKDARVRYHRNTENLGIARNYNLTYEASSETEFFKWAAHDDVLLPDYLARCVSVLDGEPGVVCVHTHTEKIDKDGNVVGLYPQDQFLDSESPSACFRDTICHFHEVIVGHALIRKSALEKTQLFGRYPGSDYALQAELALYGKLRQIPEVHFGRRSHPGRAVRIPLYERIAVEDPSKAGKIVLPAWLQWLGYHQAISRSKLPLGEKMRCHMIALKSLKRGVLLYPLARDVKWAARTILKMNPKAM